MPPATATASFFKQSRTKMQAWVTNNPGLGPNQPEVANSVPVVTYELSPPVQSDILPPQSQPQSHPLPHSQPPPQPQPQPQPLPQTLPQTLPQPPTRHVSVSQPHPPNAQVTSPIRSRSPIIHANWQRVATAAAARMPMPSHSTRAQDGPANLERDRGISAESGVPTKRQAPFWEGSTIEGSAFSDTVSNTDVNAPFSYRHPGVQVQPAQTYSARSRPAPRYQQDHPRHRAAPPRLLDRPVDPPPFIIGANGLINEVVNVNGNGSGNGNGNGLTRSASTPETRSQPGGFKEITSDHGPDPYSDDSPYNTSPEKTPSAKRLQHPKAMTLRPTRRESYSEGISLAPSHPVATAAMPSPPRPRTYINSNRDEIVEVAQVQPSRFPRLQAPEHQAQRSNIFLETNMPMASRQSESGPTNVEREPTPMPVPRAISKAKTQVNRQLFARTNKGKAPLRDSTAPRALPQRQQSTSKKRSYELDYDDGALAAMDYEALKHEAFDFDPAQAEARSVFEPPRGSLSEKLEHFMAQDEANQAGFFTQMSVKDWEESGDWFLEKFGEVIDRFKEARRQKRDIVNAFENEIAEREEAVRNKIQGIGQTLTDLKSEGEGMMLGKELK
ncbi:extracellular mutant protein 11-domain-containing protein [Xylaria sp. CBS 124048]|nr:extracellular mutant protein 11-domain-containing protein [Xylaria sp. CBS 124048]